MLKILLISVALGLAGVYLGRHYKNALNLTREQPSYVFGFAGVMVGLLWSIKSAS